MASLFSNNSSDDDGEWLSISDLMSGLMVIFLFIAIVFIRPLAEENKELLNAQDDLIERNAELDKLRRDMSVQNEQMSEIALAWQDRERKIYEALLVEFEDDLRRWDAEIEESTLLIRFNAPEVLFDSGDDNLRREFAAILANFFPRYVRILDAFRESLEEVRIEGHTSSEWTGITPEKAYIENMRLSQTRTRAVLEFVLGLNDVVDQRSWLQTLLTANGLSSSQLVRDEAGLELPDLSRRVEFRVRTTARAEIIKILEASQ
jgi:outer membrane protein OmpA-like peptidoglycan-associated protein